MRQSSWRLRRGLEALACALIVAAMGLAQGCSDQDQPTRAAPAGPSFPGVKLTLGVLGDPAILAGLSSQRGEWTASRGAELTVREGPIRSLESPPEADVLIFPGQELGGLVDAEVLEVIPNEVVLPPRPPEESRDQAGRTGYERQSEEDAFQHADIAPAFREQVTMYGRDRLALPLGGTALILAYRRDAFTRPENVEAARAKTLKLEPPATWTDLDALAAFFEGRDWDGDGSPNHGIAAVLGDDAEGLGNALFLARAASVGQHRDQFSFLFDADSMLPRINSPPFVETVRALSGWNRVGPAGIEKFDANAAREAFRTGKAALLIDRAERADAWSAGHRVGVASLPGSERVYEPLRKRWETPSSLNAPSYLPLGGGWLVGVRRGLTATQRDAAMDLVAFLANPENSNRLRSERGFPMLPVRSSQWSQGLPDPTAAPDVEPRQWADAVSRTFTAERVVPGLRIPDAAGYLQDLAAARKAVLAGKAPDPAMDELAAAWAKRTRTHGQERQLWHYRRSLNSLSTLPQPPSRGK